MGTTSLSSFLLASLPAPARASAERWPALEAVLEEMLAACRGAWPGLEIPAAVFLPYVADRAPAEMRRLDELRRVAWQDLYLACGCGQGLPSAVAHFERKVMPDAENALKAMKLQPELVDEVKQRVRLHLLVGEESQPPRISQFKGRGALLAWVRVAAVREARMRLRATQRTLPTDADLLDSLPSPEEDQELATFKRLYRAEFRQAFQAALGTLERRERLLLRYHFLDGLNIDDLGATFGVHRATAARWLVRIRGTLLERTRQGMMQRLQVSGGELQSIMRLIESRLEASLHQFLDRSGDRGDE